MNATADTGIDIEMIEQYYHNARDFAVRTVERWARKLLREHPEMGEFRMANGGYAFYQAKRPDDRVCLPGKIHTSRDLEREYLREFNNFIWEWDKRLDITTSPMKFTADGPTITDW